MKFNIVTIFPELIDSFSNIGFIKHSIKKNIIGINSIDLRKYADNKHNRVDDKSYGGGPGMVLQYEPIRKSIKNITDTGPIIYLSPQGKPLTQNKLKELSLMDNLTISVSYTHLTLPTKA